MISLGDEVKCKVSGFTGIVTAKTEYIYGCTRLSVQPKVDAQGKLPECQAFDEPQLDVISSGVVERASNNTGGDRPVVAQAIAIRR